jgi:uncharacterized protein YrrD
MKATELRGMRVVSVPGAENLGEVEDLVLNPNLDAQRVVAVRVKSVPEGLVKTVSAVDVVIGHDAVAIKEVRSIPEEELTELEGTVDLSKLLGSKVMSHGGNILGNVEDVEVEPSDLSITGYDLGKGALADLFGGKSSLPAARSIHYGEFLMVPAEVVAEMERGKAG